MNLSRSIFISLLSLFIVGCTIVNVDAPWNSEIVPVVFSVITPNQSIQVYIGKSYLKNDAAASNPYTEVKVFVKRNNLEWIELSRSVNDSSIYIDNNSLIQVVMGETYFLKIVAPNKTILSQTTVPAEKALITSAESYFPYTDTLTNDYKIGTLKSHFTLPLNTDYGYYYSSFSINASPNQILVNGIYQNDYFFCPSDSTSFLLSLITVDPYLKKFQITKSINDMQNYNVGDISTLLSSYGGVRPTFSNIQNGVGLFGSFVTDSKRVNAVMLPK